MRQLISRILVMVPRPRAPARPCPPTSAFFAHTLVFIDFFASLRFAGLASLGFAWPRFAWLRFASLASLRWPPAPAAGGPMPSTSSNAKRTRATPSHSATSSAISAANMCRTLDTAANHSPIQECTAIAHGGRTIRRWPPVDLFPGSAGQPLLLTRSV